MRRRFKVLRTDGKAVVTVAPPKKYPDEPEALILQILGEAGTALHPVQLIRRVAELTDSWDRVSISACIGRMIQGGSLVTQECGYIQESKTK